MLLTAPTGSTYRVPSGAVTASTSLTPVPSHATTAHTKNATYTELIAATAYDYHWLEINAGLASYSQQVLLDIAVGAASSEQVILANLQYHGSQSSIQPKGGNYLFPIFVKAGSRISATCQSDSGTQGNTAIAITGHINSPIGGGGGSGSFVETIGAVTASSIGTTVTPSTTAHTKGALQEIGTFTYGVRWLIVSAGVAGSGSYSDQSLLVDLYVGATSGAAQPFAENIFFCGAASGDLLFEPNRGFPCKIPAGSKIWCKGQSTIGNNIDRLFDVILYGVS